MPHVLSSRGVHVRQAEPVRKFQHILGNDITPGLVTPDSLTKAPTCKVMQLHPGPQTDRMYMSYLTCHICMPQAWISVTDATTLEKP